MIDVIIIGAGLFGRIIDKHLRSLGLSVHLVDNQEPHAGSRPAACLMKPSWFSSLGKDVYDPSLALLDKLYGVREIEFMVGAVGNTQVMWCDPKKIMGSGGGSTYMNVKRVGSGWIENEMRRLEARTIIVTAGVWSSRLVDVPDLTGRAGVTFLWPGGSIEEPFIRLWAPYRQLVAFNRGDGLWVGDGSAIKPENWTDERAVTSGRRCSDAVGQPMSGAEMLYGIRPYVPKVKPAYLKMEPGLIVATGGAKNGTLAAGWCAHKIGEYLS